MNLVEKYHNLTGINKLRTVITLLFFGMSIFYWPTYLAEGITYFLESVFSMVLISVVVGYVVSLPYKVWLVYRYPSTIWSKIFWFIISSCIFSIFIIATIGLIADIRKNNQEKKENKNDK